MSETKNGINALERFAVRYDDLPLAVYREIAAHLRCIPGVEAELEANDSTSFRYGDSQIGALIVTRSAEASESRLVQVLDYYGLWQRSQA
ncbi:MAG: hypothetical protein AAFY57_05280 [Cyanobacteria bacterium J06642_2]